MLWQHLFWIFGHPEVYILILPAFGIVSEILPVFSRKPLFGYSAMVFSGAFIAFLGFGVWSHHMFATGMGPLADSFFSLATMRSRFPRREDLSPGSDHLGWVVVPSRPAALLARLHRDVHHRGPSGVMHAVAPADLQQTDTTSSWRTSTTCSLAGRSSPSAPGLYWWPKMFGRMLDERLGRLHFWLSMIGFNLTFLPMHWVGLLGMPRRVYTYPEGLGFDVYNMAQTVGAFILALSILAFMWNLIRTWRGPANAPADPWGGATLEWTIPSPPPEFNFAEEPVVTEKDALWAMKDAAGVERLPEPQPASGKGIHMPGPSWWPLIVSVGILVFFVGFMLKKPWSFPFTGHDRSSPDDFVPPWEMSGDAHATKN